MRLAVAALLVAGCSTNAPASNDASIDASDASDANDAQIPSDAQETGAGEAGCNVGSATLVGSIRGISFAPKDAISSTSFEPIIVITDSMGLCASQSNFVASSNVLLFNFNAPSSISVGVQSLGNGVGVSFANYDNACNSPIADVGAEGEVTITSVDACGVDGTFNINFVSASHITGSFHAPSCVELPSDGGAQCEPQ